MKTYKYRIIKVALVPASDSDNLPESTPEAGKDTVETVLKSTTASIRAARCDRGEIRGTCRWGETCNRDERGTKDDIAGTKADMIVVLYRTPAVVRSGRTY